MTLFLEGWQNFFICIEMCLASIALRFAFPHETYIIRETYLPTISGTTGNGGRIVTMQSISNNLKETMNPKDIMHGKNDSRKNFLECLF
jgi:hypothetical protein